MAMKTDFAQKLLNDLRLRKERMGAAQNCCNSSSIPADAYGNSRQVLKGSREMTKVGPKIGSRFKSSSTSHKSPATVQAANQIVPYKASHHSGERQDLSMALAYAFDNGRKLKGIDFTGSGKMMDFLQQICRRSMQQGSNTQRPSTNQFPILTHLHIDEIAKSVQKLNQILRACSNGPNINKGTAEIGKELWKGAMELERSLRMLVSLQEASESTVSPKRKSRLLLLENGEEDKDNTGSKERQKQIERPVFSFDKLSKNSKSNARACLQQNLMALAYLKEDPNSKRGKQTSAISTSTFHGRSHSEPELPTSQHTNSSKQRQDIGIPNVIAKLMGLEELSHKVNPRVAAERGNSTKQKTEDIVTTAAANPSSKGAEVKIGYTNEVQGNQSSKRSNKIAILKYHEARLQQETFRLTYDCSYRATAHSQKPMPNQEEREPLRNNVNESKAAISRINELQSQPMPLDRTSSTQKGIRRETRFSSTQRKQQEVKDKTETVLTTMPVKIQSSRDADKVQAERFGNWNDQTERRATNNPLHSHDSLGAHPHRGSETQGKNVKSEDIRQQRKNNKSELRKTEAMSTKSNNSQNATSYVKKLQKQPTTKHPHSTKKINAEAKGITVSTAVWSRGQNKASANEGKASDAKNLVSVISEQQAPLTDIVSGPQSTQCEIPVEIYVKPAPVVAKKMVNEIKPPKTSSTTRTRIVKSAKKIASVLKPHINFLEVSHTSESKPKPTQITRKNTKPTAPESREADLHQTVTTNNLLTHKLQSQEEITELPPDENSPNIETSKDSGTQHNKEMVPDEVQEGRPQSTVMDVNNGSTDDSYNLQPKQQGPTKIDKQKPLTEDEMCLKQKLITSHIFLNTAEALFKLNIPSGILNYTIDQVCQGRDSKLILDCGYELMKKKGRRQEIFLHPHINTFMSCRKVKSFDDLVRQLHNGIESLRSYGRRGREEYDDADYTLRMLERDIQHRDPDINCTWDLGWNELMFAYVEMDDVIKDIEQNILDELMNEMAKDYMLGSNFTAAKTSDGE